MNREGKLSLSQFLTSIRLFSRRLVKGLLLIIWITILVSLAVIAAKEEASKFVTGYLSEYSYDRFVPSYAGFELSRHGQLQVYLTYIENPPPIGSVLDVMIPGWSGLILSNPFVEQSKDMRWESENQKSQWIDEKVQLYTNDLNYQLFKRIEDKLYAIASNKGLNPATAEISTEIIPWEFLIEEQRDQFPQNVRLPEEVTIWVEEERARIETTQAKHQLMNTFFLLIVLGAFGSMIFLTRDYIAKETATSIAAYFFRPVLGMFLAMAMFVIDILAHAVISSADILELRPEPLYLLALAAGLLSEQAYGIVHSRAEAVLERFKKENDKGK